MKLKLLFLIGCTILTHSLHGQNDTILKWIFIAFETSSPLDDGQIDRINEDLMKVISMDATSDHMLLLGSDVNQSPTFFAALDTASIENMISEFYKTNGPKSVDFSRNLPYLIEILPLHRQFSQIEVDLYGSDEIIEQMANSKFFRGLVDLMHDRMLLEGGGLQIHPVLNSSAIVESLGFFNSDGQKNITVEIE